MPSVIPMDWILGLIGGLLIGAASALMLLGQARIAGISGILGGVLRPKAGDLDWRFAFLGGLLTAGIVGTLASPDRLAFTIDRSLPVVAAAGLLVGVGTRVGNGCTSGHGVCGMSRLSPRSLIATLTFMASGMIVVFLTSSLFS